MSIDERLAALEQSVKRWRIFSVSIALGIVAYFSLGAFIDPANTQFDHVTVKRLTVAGEGGSIEMATNERGAAITLTSANVEGDKLRLRSSAVLQASGEKSALWLGALGDKALARHEILPFMAEASKRGFIASASPENVIIALQKDGKPSVGLGTDSPSITIVKPDGTKAFAQ